MHDEQEIPETFESIFARWRITISTSDSQGPLSGTYVRKSGKNQDVEVSVSGNNNKTFVSIRLVESGRTFSGGPDTLNCAIGRAVKDLYRDYP